MHGTWVSLTWALGIELGSLGLVASAFTHGAILPAPVIVTLLIQSLSPHSDAVNLIQAFGLLTGRKGVMEDHAWASESSSFHPGSLGTSGARHITDRSVLSKEEGPHEAEFPCVSEDASTKHRKNEAGVRAHRVPAVSCA